ASPRRQTISESAENRSSDTPSSDFCSASSHPPTAGVFPPASATDASTRYRGATATGARDAAAVNPAATPYPRNRFWLPRDETFPGTEPLCWDARETVPGEDTCPAGKPTIPAIVPGTPPPDGRRNADAGTLPRHPLPPEYSPFPRALVRRSHWGPISRNASGRPNRWRLTPPIPVPWLSSVLALP